MVVGLDVAKELYDDKLSDDNSNKINNKRIRTPNYICTSKDIISIQTKQGVREIKLSQFKLN